MSTHPTDPAPSTPLRAAGPVVAIDGPAGSGKSTVAGAVAVELGVPHLDTGALYRAVTLACLRAGVDLDDPAACAAVARSVVLDRRDGRTYLDGTDVEEEIRGDEVTAAVSTVAAHEGVRTAMTPIQRSVAASAGAVVEGRDIGTVVFPDADLKVFLTASVEERTRRRAEQVGAEPDAALRAEIERRDHHDATRSVAPLVRAPDAWELDTTGMATHEVVEAVVDVATAAWRDRTDQRPSRPDPFSARRSLPRVAVVGRPNVGKSTLVNRIIGDRVTIVEEKPGVTRDRTEHLTSWRDRPFMVVDTGGWEHGAAGMAARIVAQAEAAVADADVVVFTVDATVGALEDDERYAKLLRRSDRPVLLVANKVDSDRQEPLVHELYSLGLGTPHPVSARHGRGVGDLLDEVVALLPETPAEVPDETAVPHVALIGKPNVGKSSLFNTLLGEERSIVDPVPHTTRDAVDTMVEIDGEPWVFVDTAGMRRRYRHGEDTELYSVDRTRRAIQLADIVLFVLDASEPLGEQDQRLAALIRDSGRGLVLVLNKWDLVDEDRRFYLEKELDRLLSFASWAPRVNISATTGRGVRRLVPHLRTVWDNYRQRIPTRELNRFVEEATARVPPPSQGQKTLRVKYVTQAETAPPRFITFTNGKLPASYRRYLERQLREHYDFTGVPVSFDERPPRDRAGRG